MRLIVLSIIGSMLLNVLWAQPNIELELIASGFNAPLSIQNAGDSRLFIVERAGLIKIINPDGSINPVPFLDIDDKVVTPGGVGDEGGLLGLAFHPDYSSNGYFYVHYINNDIDSVISRFSVNTSNPDLADAESESVILNIFQPQPNHNGGDLAFGPEGFLYIAMGDGGSPADSDNNGQRLDTLLGKILRIDVNSDSPYAIPPTNPFVNDGDLNTLGEIWAYGLRNPWRISFDAFNGDLWIADVGQGVSEEINLASAGIGGQNYGWRCYEGSSIFNDTACTISNEITFPIAEYPHIGSSLYRCSITGGYRYRGTNTPGFQGIYFFADYCSDEIGTLQLVGSNWEMNFSSSFGNQGFAGFGQDVMNDLYVAALTTGNIYKIVEGTLNQDENSVQSILIYPNPAHDYFNLIHDQWNPETLDIINIKGQLVERHILGEGPNFQIPTGKLTKGLYIVKVYDTGGTPVIKKLIIR